MRRELGVTDEAWHQRGDLLSVTHSEKNAHIYDICFRFFLVLLSVGALSQQGLQGAKRTTRVASSTTRGVRDSCSSLRRAGGGYGASVLRRRMVVVLVREGRMQFVTKLQDYFLGVFALHFKLRFLFGSSGVCTFVPVKQVN
jgi:hypothetical protein